MVNPAGHGGRPRRSGVVEEAPREGILTVAAKLFAERGFHATRMTEIARQAGLGQSSIYYWFRGKDDILRAIMEQNRVSLTAARLLSGREEPAAVRLFIVLYQDVVQLCSAPLNFYAFEEAANGQPDVFSGFHEEYAELRVRLRGIVADGVRAGEFCEVEPDVFVRTALSLTEGSQHRFHAQAPPGPAMHDVADAAASMAVRALLRDPEALPQVRAAASAGILGLRAAEP